MDESILPEELRRELQRLRARVEELESAHARLHDPAAIQDDQENSPSGKSGEPLDPNERSYREFLDRLEAVAYRLDFDFRPLFLHGAIKSITGYREEEIMAETPPWKKLVHPEDEPRLRSLFERLRNQQEDTIELECRIIRKDGGIRWISDHVHLVRDATGRPFAFQGIAYDVTRQKDIEEALRRARDELELRIAERTSELANSNAMLLKEVAERHQAEQAVRESDETARALLNVATEGAILVELDSTIVTLNAMAAERLGGSIEDLVGRRCFELMSPEVIESRRAFGEEVVRTGRPVRFQDVQDGRYTDTNVHPIFDNAGNVVRLAVFNRDITEVKRAEENIRREQQLLHQLLDFHERERQLVAYEIHDGLAQELTGAIFRFQAFRELLADRPEEAWKTFDVGLNLLTKGVQEARSLITGLRPPILDELGIAPAIEYLVCENQERGGLQVEFQHNLQADRLAPSLQTTIFRIVQESLTNARRHSQSTRVHLELHECAGILHIDVRDWGIGFNPGDTEGKRFGLEGLRERTRLLGGQMTIDSTPGEGTHLHVELPIIEPSPNRTNGDRK